MAWADPDAVKVEIRWPDVDEFGHVSHIAMVAIAEHGRSRWLDAAFGVEPQTWPYVVARLELDFRSPASFADRFLCCHLTVESVGTSSITFRERLEKPDGTLVMEATSVVVAWDKETSSGRSLDAGERAALVAAMRARCSGR